MRCKPKLDYIVYTSGIIWENFNTERVLEISVALKRNLFANIVQYLSDVFHQIPTRIAAPKRTTHHPTQPAERSDVERLMEKKSQ